jgi:hypothetical protein
MPVIIKELIIRATVTDTTKSQSASSGAVPALTENEREILVTECVNQVLEILEKKEER